MFTHYICTRHTIVHYTSVITGHPEPAKHDGTILEDERHLRNAGKVLHMSIIICVYTYVCIYIYIYIYIRM